MRLPFFSLALATGAALAMPREAHATEKEWHIGASLGYSSLGFSRGRDENGAGGFLHARYGFTDAFDFTMNASFFGYIDVNQTRFAPATSAFFEPTKTIEPPRPCAIRTRKASRAARK